MFLLGWLYTGSMKSARAYHTASVLKDGKVLVSGGYDGATPSNSAELYDPSTKTWTTTSNMNSARFRHTASVLSDGKVLVSGGVGGSNTAELYQP